MFTFTTETMQQILPLVQQALKKEEHVSFETLDPDLFDDAFNGESVEAGGRTYRYHSLKAWTDLAELLHCRMMLPQKCDGARHIIITFKKLSNRSFHTDTVSDKKEKYGTASQFARLNKLEEPAFAYYYLQALQNAGIQKRRCILNLGINRGDEFEAIRQMVDAATWQQMQLTGIDHSQSAIEEAGKRFGEGNVSLHAADIQTLESLSLGTFDLLISIGTLQSPGIAYKPLLMSLVQEYLDRHDSALILGFPNSRWIGTEMLYGAKAPNYAMSEMGLLLNDVMFAKKYLQQKRYRVTVTGKHYLFLTATKIHTENNR
jgi:hypothetical protein